LKTEKEIERKMSENRNIEIDEIVLKRFPSFEYMYIPNGPRASRESEKSEIEATLNVSAGFRKTKRKKAGDGIFETDMKPRIPISLPRVKRNQRKRDMEVALLLELENAEMRNPKETKDKESRKTKKMIFRKMMSSEKSNLRKKRDTAKEIKGAEKTTNRTERNFAINISDFFTGKESIYSRDRFSLDEEIDKLAGSREKIGIRRNDRFTTDARNLPIP